MVTKLFGIGHDEKHVDEVIINLGDFKKGQTVALEITPEELSAFENAHRRKLQVSPPYCSEQLSAFYKIFKHITGKGGKCFSLDSAYAIEKKARSKNSGVAKTISIPIRERFFAKRIAKTKPDYAIGGFTHIYMDEVKRILDKIGYESEVVFRQKYRGKHSSLLPLYLGTVERCRKQFYAQKDAKIAARRIKFKHRKNV